MRIAGFPCTSIIPEMLRNISIFKVFRHVLNQKQTLFTYALFFKDNINGLWRAFIYDMDYMAMLYAGYSCTVCDDYVSFKKDFFKTIDENVENVRDYLEAMDLEEEPEFYDRDAKNMIEGHELFATDPERFFREATPLE